MSVKSNPKRELARTQTALNDAVAQYLYEVYRREHLGGMPTTRVAVRLAALRDAYRDWSDAAKVLEGAGPASARNTSIAAAHTNLPSKSSVRFRVIREVAYWQDRGATTAELEQELGRSHQTVSSAVNYAEAAGWIKDSGRTRKTQFGRDAIVYVATDRAYEAMTKEWT